jgi:hypothetical protein
MAVISDAFGPDGVPVSNPVGFSKFRSISLFSCLANVSEVLITEHIRKFAYNLMMHKMRCTKWYSDKAAFEVWLWMFYSHMVFFRVFCKRPTFPVIKFCGFDIHGDDLQIYQCFSIADLNAGLDRMCSRFCMSCIFLRCFTSFLRKIRIFHYCVILFYIFIFRSES